MLFAVHAGREERALGEALQARKQVSHLLSRWDDTNIVSFLSICYCVSFTSQGEKQAGPDSIGL